MEIYYELKNTGNVEIDYYEVYFLITFINGDSTTGWDNGLSVPPNQVRLDSTYIFIGGKTVQQVKVFAINLVNHEHNLHVTIKP